MSLLKFFRRRFWDDERHRELESYLEIETESLVARGMAPDEARAAARRRLGNATLIREEIYQMNTIDAVDSAWRDLKYGARLLRRDPGFAVVAILSLALGIGANTAIFQLLDAVQFRLLPVRQPDRLVEVRPVDSARWGDATGRSAYITYAIWDEVRRRQEAFSDMFAWGVNKFDLSTAGESRLVDGLWVSGAFFDVLGVVPERGRLLAEPDDRPGCGSPGVVISYAFWQREYGGTADAVGRTLRLDNHPFEILGVTPPSFTGIEVGRTFDVAVPICSEPLVEPARNAVAKRHFWWLDMIGRLKPGWTIERANAHVGAIAPAVFAATVAPAFPPNVAKQYLSSRLTALPAGTGVSQLRNQYEQPLWILLAVAALVLTIACANLANLMLARASAREREIAVRLAIGASRGRVVRQLLAESLLLAAIGAALGVAVAQWGSVFLVRFISTANARLFFDLTRDWRVLAFTAGLAAATCLLFGLAPAVRATRQSAGALGTMLKAGGRGGSDSRERFGLRRALVAVQVALSLVLVVGALLFVRTVRNLADVEAGFRSDGVLVADFDVRGSRVPMAGRAAFQRTLRARIAAVPGVEAAADAAIEPGAGSGWNDRILIGGLVQQTIANENGVSPGFFGLLGTPILAGRDFDRRDGPGSPYVAIVNESFAAKLLGVARPGLDAAIGRTFRRQVSPGDPDPTFEVIGVAADTKYSDVREAAGPIAYFPEAQGDDAAGPEPLTEIQVLVRGRGDLAPAITAAAREVSPALLVSYRTMAGDIQRGFLRERLMAALSGFFGALAVLLAMIGLYGVVSYMVARRRNEIGIRLALGADRGAVVGLIMRDAGVLLGAGLVAGIVLSLLAARSASGLLFGVAPSDPATIAAAAIGLSLVAALATYVPARRASRLDPTVALREE